MLADATYEIVVKAMTTTTPAIDADTKITFTLTTWIDECSATTITVAQPISLSYMISPDNREP